LALLFRFFLVGKTEAVGVQVAMLLSVVSVRKGA